MEHTALFSLDGPPLRGNNDYARIVVAASLPDDVIPDAKVGIELAERNASSWKGYELIKKCVTEVAGYHAYRIDYRIVNIIPALAGEAGDLPFKIYREVRFDTKGYVWMIEISSPSSTAESDEADFEHILETFKTLD